MVNKRMGRPPKPNTQKKSKTVQVRMTGAEYRRLAKIAKNAGLSVSEFLRQAAFVVDIDNDECEALFKKQAGGLQ